MDDKCSLSGTGVDVGTLAKRSHESAFPVLEQSTLDGRKASFCKVVVSPEFDAKKDADSRATHRVLLEDSVTLNMLPVMPDDRIDHCEQHFEP